MNKWIFLFGLVGAVAAVGACSSDSSDGSSGGGNNCGNTQGGAGSSSCPARDQCEQSKCSSELATLSDPNGACKDLISCSQACGCDDTACRSNCGMKGLVGSCGQAIQALQQCETTNCGNVTCSGTQGGGGTTGAAGTTGSAGSGTAGSGTTGTGVTCDFSSKGSCNVYPGGASQMQYESVCMQQGGTVVASCPTANLVGCCTIQGGYKTCYYSNDNGSDPGPYEMSCMATKGTWSTSP